MYLQKKKTQKDFLKIHIYVWTAIYTDFPNLLSFIEQAAVLVHIICLQFYGF